MDYCVDRLSYPNWLYYIDETGPYGMCEGDCDTDDDCTKSAGLYCFDRVGFDSVPGCEGDGRTGSDYCTNEGVGGLATGDDSGTTSWRPPIGSLPTDSPLGAGIATECPPTTGDMVTVTSGLRALPRAAANTFCGIFLQNIIIVFKLDETSSRSRSIDC